MAMNRKIESNLEVINSSHGMRVAIIGASGYGGIQTVRLLCDHPHFQITYLGGMSSAGMRWNEICPFLPLPDNPLIHRPEPKNIAEVADFVVLSLPNGIACQLVPELLKLNLRVVDLSADYRYRSLDHWKHIYNHEAQGLDRSDDTLCSEAVYGIPEWNPTEISNARLVASPGCFPTASLLPLLPFLKQGLIENEGLIVDAKSGTSGGGRKAKENLLFAECSESISPYSVLGHRHTSEIEQIATQVSGHEIQLQFTPHLVPMVRGILSTVYARLRDPGLTAEDCSTVLSAVYRHEPTIDILPVGTYPSTKWVKQTNKALLSLQVDNRNGRIVLMTVIDNLVKGQAGQGIQSLNLMAGFAGETGLPLLTYYP